MLPYERINNIFTAIVTAIPIAGTIYNAFLIKNYNNSFS